MVTSNWQTTLMPAGSQPQPPVKVPLCWIFRTETQCAVKSIELYRNRYRRSLTSWLGGGGRRNEVRMMTMMIYAQNQNRARFSRGACDFPLNNQLRNRSIALATLFWGWWGTGPCSGGTHRWFRSITPLVNLPFAGEVTWINYKPDCRFSERVLGVEFARTAMTPFWISSISKVEGLRPLCCTVAFNNCCLT